MAKLKTLLNKEQIEAALDFRREDLNAAVRQVPAAGVSPGLIGQISHDIDVLNALLRQLSEPSDIETSKGKRGYGSRF